MSAETQTAARKVTRHADDRPRQSTRELEVAFAKQSDRMPMAGLALGLTISAGLWVGIAAIVL